jgi:hypothetical protein
VDARQCRSFIDNLIKRRFITVLGVDAIGVDREVASRVAGYLYGDDPVVRLVVTCEAVFFRDWTTPLMPDIIKRLPGVAILPPLTPGASGT